MRIRAFFVAAAIGLFGSDASANLIDIANGAPVILNGEYESSPISAAAGIRPSLPPLGPRSPTGFLRPQATVWQEGAVWWDATNPGSAANLIEIDLGGFHALRAFSVQADDNDTYRIEVLTPADVWVTVWDIPAVGGFGSRRGRTRLIPPTSSSSALRSSETACASQRREATTSIPSRR